MLVLFAVRDGERPALDACGLPELRLEGLRRDAAEAVLDRGVARQRIGAPGTPGVPQPARMKPSPKASKSQPWTREPIPVRRAPPALTNVRRTSRPTLVSARGRLIEAASDYQMTGNGGASSAPVEQALATTPDQHLRADADLLRARVWGGEPERTRSGAGA